MVRALDFLALSCRLHQIQSTPSHAKAENNQSVVCTVGRITSNINVPYRVVTDSYWAALRYQRSQLMRRTQRFNAQRN